MKRLLGSIFDVRKGEVAITALMFATYYLILVTYYFLKPARDSLFLVKVSPEMLPLVFILTALVTAPVITLYSRASRSLKLNQLIYISYAVLIVCLLALRYLVQINQSWPPKEVKFLSQECLVRDQGVVEVAVLAFSSGFVFSLFEDETS